MSAIVLIGYRGTGKTSVGRLLSERLNLPLIDTDQLIQERQKKTIAEIFAESGEEKFRCLETEVLAELAERKDFFILSTGGGIPIREENRRLLRRVADRLAAYSPLSTSLPMGMSVHSLIVWLTASPSVILTRVRQDKTTAAARPALTALSEEEEIRTILERRRAFYQELADWTVTTDALSPEAIAEAIIAEASKA